MTFRAPLYQPYAYTAGDPPPLPMRSLGDPGVPISIVRAALTSQYPHGVTLAGQTTSGADVKIEVNFVAPGIARVLLETAQPDPRRVRLARAMPNSTFTASVLIINNQVFLKSDTLQVRIDPEPFHITFLMPDGELLLEQNTTLRDLTGRFMTLPFGYTDIDGKRVAFHDSFTVEPDEHFYGGGEKFTTFDKRGQRLEMWNYDACGVLNERSYKNVPFLMSTRGYGIFVDSITHINLDVAASSSAILSLIVPDSALDYYLIAGPDPKTIIGHYADLVSHPTLLPKWAFGLWVSSGWLPDGDDQEKALERARRMRQYDIPCDVMHLDSYWQRFGCWSDLIWDQEAFPDPESMIRKMKDQGYKICIWIDPRIGVKSERFEEGSAKGYFLKTAQGETQIVDSWDGFHPPVGNLDFTNPDAVAWFKDLLRSLLRMGVDAIKPDNGEKIPNDAVAYNGMTGLLLHNYYALLYNDAVAEAIVEETGRKPMLWGRASYAGGQRHSAQWGGDPGSTFQEMIASLRGGLSIGLCGHAFWSHDVGGFGGKPTTDLYLRWAQFGLFSPLTRLHGMSTRLPWDYGEEALRIFRDYVRLRYSLLPYLYTYAVISAETSLPMLRAMWLEFPGDPSTYALDLQYMFGAEILVAPIYNSTGQRFVYFPAGRWVDFWTHEVIQGPKNRSVTAPLEVLPLYIRANALIPTIEPPQFIQDTPFEFVVFNAYLLDQGSFTLRDMDGRTDLSARLVGSQLDLSVEGVKKQLGLRVFSLPDISPVESVSVNGIALPRRERLELKRETTPGWYRNPNGEVQIMIH